ncbi:MAG: hypothetical protein IJS08_00750, partial [Victivallales bacterium]|nr:hypothetical protein [Victivallales bacterium]
MASQVQNHTVPAGLPQLWLDCPNLNRQPMLQSIFDKSYSISMADPLRPQSFKEQSYLKNTSSMVFF